MVEKGPVRRPRIKRGVETGKKKEFTYRGKTIAELQAMPQEEVLLLMPSRVRRTFKRGLGEEHQHLLARLSKAPGAELRTHLRDMPILPAFVGRTFQVHNGKEFQRVDVTPEMLGHYLGE